MAPAALVASWRPAALLQTVGALSGGSLFRLAAASCSFTAFRVFQPSSTSMHSVPRPAMSRSPSGELLADGRSKVVARVYPPEARPEGDALNAVVEETRL